MGNAMQRDIFLDRAVISHNHDGEGICGDFYGDFGSMEHPVSVLSDGMGSGVKANIMSTITTTILGRLMEHGIPLSECVDTIAASLPLCKDRGMAYATFTAAQIRDNQLHLVEYDNPPCIIFRNGQPMPAQYHVRFVGDKEIHERSHPLQHGDILVMMSDGVTHSGIGISNDNGWNTKEIGEFLATTDLLNNSALETAALLDQRCNEMSNNTFGDDRTIAVMRFCTHATANLVMGPPTDVTAKEAALDIFFAKKGTRIVCGGSTSHIVSEYLGKPIELLQGSGDAEVPDMAHIDGIDLVTEGVITLQKTLELCDYIEKNPPQVLTLGHRPHELLYRELFIKSSNINIFFGTASNVAHANTSISFENKLSSIKLLHDKLEKAGKIVRIQYY